MQAASLAGNEVRHVDRFLHVPAGLGEHLTHLLRHQAGQVLFFLNQHLGGAEQDLRAPRRGVLPPLLKRALGRLDRSGDVFGA